jgi:hypothetical protein
MCCWGGVCVRLQPLARHDGDLRGNEDTDDTSGPSAQHQHNNQPYEKGEEAIVTKRKVMSSVGG